MQHSEPGSAGLVFPYPSKENGSLATRSVLPCLSDALNRTCAARSKALRGLRHQSATGVNRDGAKRIVVHQLEVRDDSQGDVSRHIARHLSRAASRKLDTGRAGRERICNGLSQETSCQIQWRRLSESNLVYAELSAPAPVLNGHSPAASENQPLSPWDVAQRNSTSHLLRKSIW